MAKPYGKSINFLKKLTPRPSTQVSGTPWKSIKGVTSLFKAVTLKGRGNRHGIPSMPRGGQWLLDSSGHTTAGKTVTVQDYYNNTNLNNPFYNYLIENSIARTTSTIIGGTTLTSIKVIATGVDNLLKRGDTFYLYNTSTFRCMKLTALNDLTATGTSITIASTTFKMSQMFSTGSYIIADNKQQIKRVSEGLQYKKYTLTNAEYKALNSTPYTLLDGTTDYINMPISCYIQYIHGADEMTRGSLYIGHNASSVLIGDYWGSVGDLAYRARNNQLYQIGASTYSAEPTSRYKNTPLKSNSNDGRASALKLYTSANFTSASSYIIVHLWYNIIKT